MAYKNIPQKECPHIAEMKVLESDKIKCEVCDVREHLRLCTSCGKVFCCESSNAHNREHFQATDHPIIKPAPTGGPYTFTWCWKCDAYLK